MSGGIPLLPPLPPPPPPPPPPLGGGGGATGPNDAVTFRAASNVRGHVPVPEPAPDQPSNVEPAAGVAVRVTVLPSAYVDAHPPAHVTVPEPEPERVTVSANDAG